MKRFKVTRVERTGTDYAITYEVYENDELVDTLLYTCNLSMMYPDEAIAAVRMGLRRHYRSIASSGEIKSALEKLDFPDSLVDRKKAFGDV